MTSAIVGAISGAGRRRRCPACGHRQTVSVFLSNDSVKCHRCGADIPPAKPRSKPKTTERRK